MKKQSIILLAMALLMLSACESSSKTTKKCAGKIAGQNAEATLIGEKENLLEMELRNEFDYKGSGITKEQLKSSESLIISDFLGIDGVSANLEVNDEMAFIVINIDFEKVKIKDLEKIGFAGNILSNNDFGSVVKFLEKGGMTCK
ncbi:MAG: DUF1307 domain-containing protein [Breznakia sp.]